jgi:hypothetical protein
LKLIGVVRTYLFPLTNMLSASLLEQALIVRDTVFAVDEAISMPLLAIASSPSAFREMRPFSGVAWLLFRALRLRGDGNGGEKEEEEIGDIPCHCDGSAD